MSKKEQAAKQTVEQLLERERNKNRRIVTGVLISVALLAGIVIGYFGSIEIITNAQAKAVSVVTVKS